MIINKLKSLTVITAISIASFNIAFAVDCEDSAGIFGNSCDTMLNSFGMTCDQSMGTTLISEACPVSCNTCPGVCGDGIFDWDETGIIGGGPSGLTYCPADIPGCDMAENTLALRSDGSVLYNASDTEAIYGFQFYAMGTYVTAAPTIGDAFAYLANISAVDCPAGDCGTGVVATLVIGYDTDGASIPAGSCGTLLKLSLEGTSTGLDIGLDSSGNTRLLVSAAGGVNLGYSCAEGCYDGSLSVIRVYGIPESFTLGNNYPNPFNPSTAISFDVPKTITGDISLKIYDLSGKEIITLASGAYLPGKYTVNWNAVNNFGESVASGMYVYRYVSNEQAITRKMLYMK